jgi:hypothetical protein
MIKEIIEDPNEEDYVSSDEDVEQDKYVTEIKKDNNERIQNLIRLINYFELYKAAANLIIKEGKHK